MSIVEIEAAIAQLPTEDIDELMSWLESYRESWRKEIVDVTGAVGFDAIIAEAYSSGDPSPLTKADIDAARQIVKERITARTMQG